MNGPTLMHIRVTLTGLIKEVVRESDRKRGRNRELKEMKKKMKLGGGRLRYMEGVGEGYWGK